MAWLYLILGGAMEVIWAIGLMYTDGFTNIKIVIPTLIFLFLSFVFFAQSLKYLPLSTAYAIFTGLGAFGTAIIGMLFLKDEITITKIILVITLISCIIGLKLVPDKAKNKEDN